MTFDIEGMGTGETVAPKTLIMNAAEGRGIFKACDLSCLEVLDWSPGPVSLGQ